MPKSMTGQGTQEGGPREEEEDATAWAKRMGWSYSFRTSNVLHLIRLARIPPQAGGDDPEREAQRARRVIKHLVEYVEAAGRYAGRPWPVAVVVDGVEDEVRDSLKRAANDADWHRGAFSLYVAPMGDPKGEQISADQIVDLLLQGSATQALPARAWVELKPVVEAAARTSTNALLQDLERFLKTKPFEDESDLTPKDLKDWVTNWRGTP